MDTKRNLFAPSATDGPEPREREVALIKAIGQYGSYVLGYFGRAVGNPQWAEDLAQDLWIHVAEKFAIRQMSDLPLILHKAFQILVDARRYHGRRSFVSTVEQLPEIAHDINHAAPASPEEEERLKARFWELFEGASITEQQKEAFWLNKHRGHTLDEVSTIMNVPVSTLHDWIGRLKRECIQHFNNL